MTYKHNGGPAFPLPVEDEQCRARFESGYGGMTLRDWFAGLALQGICASGPGSQWSNEMLVQEAYQLADTMLEAREKQE